MKIIDIITHPLLAPRPEAGKETPDHFLPYWTKLSKSGVRAYHIACFVKVVTDENIVGIGECTVRQVPESHASIIENLLKPIIIGEDPFDVEVLWEQMFSSLRTRGHSEGFFLEAISGVDIALWDIIGKATSKPVHKLMGGAHSGLVKAYASSIYFGTPEEVASEARRLTESGHDQMKLKVGMSRMGMGRDADIMNVKAIRDAVGYEVDLMVDANSAFTPASAVAFGRKLEHYEVSWFEEPVPPDDMEGYIEVARSLDVPVCGSESLFGRYNYRDLISKRAVDIAQPNVARCGGLSEAKKIAAIAEAYDTPMTFHIGLSGAGCRAASLQLAATLPRELFLTYEYMYRPSVIGNEVLQDPVEKFKSGYVELPTKSGLGIDLRDEVLEKYSRRKR